jgi:putative ABC transport system permease protein
MAGEAGWSARLALAWRILAYDKDRTAIAVAGVFLAILLVFVQLDFFSAVPRGGMLFYDRTRFDLLIASSNYKYQVQPGKFLLRQLDKAKTAPGWLWRRPSS